MMSKVKNSPMVTFGLPTVNSEKRLSVLLDSLLAQSYEDFNILISDNASTDRTHELCIDYAAKDKRITVFRQPERICMRDNFRYLLDKAVTKYFSWQSDDDYLSERWLETTIDALNSDLTTRMAFTDSVFEKNGAEVDWPRNYELSDNIVTRIKQLCCDNEFKIWFFCGLNGLWHTDHLQKTFDRLVEIYDQEFLFGTDILLMFNAVINNNYCFIKERMFTKRNLTDQRVTHTGLTYGQRYEQSKQIIDQGAKYMTEVVELSSLDKSTKRKLAAIIKRVVPRATTNASWMRRMKWRLFPWYKKEANQTLEASESG